MNNETYEDDRYCPNCKRETPHRFTSAGHERDSFYDRWECLECGDSALEGLDFDKLKVTFRC